MFVIRAQRPDTLEYQQGYMAEVVYCRNLHEKKNSKMRENIYKVWNSRDKKHAEMKKHKNLQGKQAHLLAILQTRESREY